MGWSVGYDDNWKRDIGYGVPAICDHPGCNNKIDRGLSHVCGYEPFGGERGCGLYFCAEHLWAGSLCARCINSQPPFEARPDIPEWLDWKMTDPSWAKWRAEQHI